MIRVSRHFQVTLRMPHSSALYLQLEATGYPLRGFKRIWPFGDPFGVFSHKVVLTEDEQRSVDSEAVLPHRYGVVQGHSSGSLGH